MSRRARILILIIVIGIAGSILLFTVRNTDFSPNDETMYAEVPSAPAQSLSNTASTTDAFKFPILVYHIVRPSYPSDSLAVRNLAHTPEVFDAEMKYLGNAGYHVVTFRDLENHFHNRKPLPKKPVIISFDDGWSDQFKYAFPILLKYHYPATFFVFTNPIGTKGFITWDELRTMQNAGMTIGSHSRSHPYLTRISNPDILWNEISGSKQVLERQLGTTTNEFAYPFGQYTTGIMAAVEKAGYLSARGDRYYKGEQTLGHLYELDALNAPTTLAQFQQKFP